MPVQLAKAPVDNAAVAAEVRPGKTVAVVGNADPHP
ncbi:MAG: hypothetical protein QOI21_2354 [Actinomycetota bacterium]|jgi:hypothetical protein|nr:hypothetical protein [Actinomycetota bacterium]MDX6252733.1 hypothetical protein [Kribbellaceae bacterium]